MNLLDIITKYIPKVIPITKLSRYLFTVQLLRQSDLKNTIRNHTIIGVFTLLLGCYLYIAFAMIQVTADTTIADHVYNESNDVHNYYE
ncbi:hypothetical protein [uncultured Aquimarina sp.]|uniref:hypothetical protein n=1 Tax=uncultured Aquimarina sp. TaxID=575652 RepID=UPI002619554D|nr:hypothetical protein [uncultured Aquimarina sp.]